MVNPLLIDGFTTTLCFPRSRAFNLNLLIYVFRWSKQVKDGGTYKLKLKKIATVTHEKFLEADADHQTVHDLDLRRWALQESRNLAPMKFKASASWLYHFNKARGIVSRKITKFVSRADIKVVNVVKTHLIKHLPSFFTAFLPLLIYFGFTRAFRTENQLRTQRLNFNFRLPQR